ncbi:hypothetical protein L1987_30197 [Smallanthus sonchifolius]|uniref:Uncharacterized protein n=1 Tax=Smallanthus sonchifolius TaxID=185202 RepID=A0ACB9I1Z2_9ASTR|nr:hypothetical protein L1987_30197 [Smallanthus sonchifolius]
MVISSLLHYFRSSLSPPFIHCRLDERWRSFHCDTWTSSSAIHHRPRRSFHTGRITTTVVRPGRRPACPFTAVPVHSSAGRRSGHL